MIKKHCYEVFILKQNFSPHVNISTKNYSIYSLFNRVITIQDKRLGARKIYICKLFAIKIKLEECRDSSMP